MKIIEFDEKYRDDMIFMVLSAKNALGRIPKINKDLLDVKTNYLDKGHPFFLALDEFDRVIGCVGTKEDDNGRLFLSRLYVKYDCKRRGIGSMLLDVAEKSGKDRGYKTIHAHLSKEYLESHIFYPKHGYQEYREEEELYMVKKL